MRLPHSPIYVSSILVSLFLTLQACLPARGAVLKEPEHKSSPAATLPPVRTEGQWEVTPVGKAEDGWRLHEIPELNRLVFGIDSRPPQLWDTRTGKRIAIFDEQTNGMDACAASPDKKHIVIADRVGISGWHLVEDEKKKEAIIRSLWIRESETGKLIRKVDVDQGEKQLRYSTDWRVHWLKPRRILIQLDSRMNPARASGRTLLTYLDPQTGNLEPWREGPARSESIVTSPDGTRAVLGREYGQWRSESGSLGWGGRGTTFTVPLMNMETLTWIANLDDEKTRAEHDRSIVMRAWSPDSRRVATVRGDYTVHIWDQDGKRVSELKGHQKEVLNVSFSRDGERVVTASDDESARVWDVKTGNVLVVLKGHTAGLNRALFNSAGDLVATAGEDETVRLWNAKTGEQVRTWGQYTSPVRNLAFDGDQRLWTQSLDGGERTWLLKDGSLAWENKTTKTSWRRHGSLYLNDTKEGIEVWSGPPGVPGESTDNGVPQAMPARILHGHINYPCVATPDGRAIVTMSDGNTLWIWDPERWDKVTGTGRVAVEMPPGRLRSVAISANGKTVAAGFDDGSLLLVDAAGGKVRGALKGHTMPIRALAFSPDGGTLISGSDDKTIRFWDATAARAGAVIADQIGAIRSLTISRDGRRLATGGTIRNGEPNEKDDFNRAGELRVWNIPTAKEIQHWDGFERAVIDVAFSPDGQSLVALGDDETVRIFDLARATKLDLPKERVGHAAMARFTPDGKRLALTDRYDGIISLWDPRTGAEHARVSCPFRVGGLLELSLDGKRVITAGSSIHLWNLSDIETGGRR